LPQLVSTALAVAVMDNVKLPEDLELSGGGLRDASRLADSAYNVWRDICFTNAENLEQALTTLAQTLEHLRDNLKSRELEHLFEKSNDLRRRLKTPAPTR